MTITRITKDEYLLECCRETFHINRASNGTSWVVHNEALKVYHVADDLAEAIDFIDYIILIT